MQGSAPLLTTEHLNRLNDGLLKNISVKDRDMLNALPAEDIAHILASSPPKQRSLIWKLVDPSLEGDVLSELGEELQKFFLESMNISELVEILSGQDSDDLADLLQQLPERISTQVLERLSSRDRQRVSMVLSYPEDTAGGMMNTDTLSVHPDLSVKMVLRYFKQGQKLPEPLDHLYVLEHGNMLVGVISFSRLLTSSEDAMIRDIMEENYVEILVSTLKDEVSHIFERRSLVSAPVVNEKGMLLGRITVDDVMDAIVDKAEYSMMGRVGLNENSDTFASTWVTTRRRALWLCINLFTAMISASVIGLFQGTIEKVVALAVLMPIVASMGGNAGYQAMMLVIRAFSQGQIGQKNMHWLLSRELGVGLLNGLLWGVVVSLIAWVWFGNTTIAVVIALAMVINLVFAVMLGTVLPGVLRYFHIDPTLAGSVVLTTATDAIGFCCFLGLSALFFM